MDLQTLQDTVNKRLSVISSRINFIQQKIKEYSNNFTMGNYMKSYMEELNTISNKLGPIAYPYLNSQDFTFGESTKFDKQMISILEDLDYVLPPSKDLPDGVDWKGKIVYMTPDKFLHLAAPLPEMAINKASIEKLKERFENNMPVDPLILFVDMNTKKVTGHEGRHRAMVCKNVGINKVPVFIFTGSGYTRTPKWSPEQHKEVDEMEGFQPERY